MSFGIVIRSSRAPCPWTLVCRVAGGVVRGEWSAGFSKCEPRLAKSASLAELVSCDCCNHSQNVADEIVVSYTSGGQWSELVVSMLKSRYWQGWLHLGALVESLLLPLPASSVRIPWLVAT